MAPHLLDCLSKKISGVPRLKITDASIFTNVSSKDYANQLTLMDSRIFKKINTEEFAQPSFKATDRPNLSEFINNFNYTSFWVIREVLKGTSPKQRAKYLEHFIKIAKALHKLNNLHSEFAIVSALQSAPLARLHRSWKKVPKKQLRFFQKQSDLFAIDGNFKNLRNHMLSIKKPCIPFIGLFSKDMKAIDAAFPLQEVVNDQRQEQMNKILKVITEHQQSNYDHLPVLVHIQYYLEPIFYSEELRKSLESAYYFISQDMEPTAKPIQQKSCGISTKSRFEIEEWTENASEHPAAHFDEVQHNKSPEKEGIKE